MSREELDRKILAYKSAPKSVWKYRNPLDVKIAAYFESNPDAKAIYERARRDPEEMRRWMKGFQERMDSRMYYGESGYHGQVLSVR